MDALLITSISIFVGYISFTYFRYGLLPSISDSFYYLREDKIEYLFTLFIWTFILPVIISGSTPLMFFAGAFIAFVGASPAFKDDSMTRKVHTVGAIGGIIFGFLSMIIDFQLYFIAIIGVSGIGLIFLFVPKNKVFWVEVLSFSLIIFGLLIS